LKTSPVNPSGQPIQALPEPVTMLATEKVVIRPSGEGVKPARRPFPGPRNADVALRVSFERRANADLIAHAKESLEVEVCGVLAGELCEDDEGLFVHVVAAIRGTAATEASTHVTFTQATWNSIHQTLERDYPNLKIVGWYHTHPGFGVEFSDMDLFIQQNFFGGPAQIALVTDPLSGAVAICLNTAKGVRYLPRFWVDGREQTCRIPAPRGHGAASGGAAGGPTGAGISELAQLEARVSQLVQAIDEQRSWQHNFMLFCGFVVCLGVIVGVGYFIFKTYSSRLEPPQVRQMIPVAIQVGDKTVMLGVGVVEWKVPDELNAILLQEDLMRKEAAEREAREIARKLQKEGKAPTNGVPGTTNAASPPTPAATNK
jgi:proteasome lid subunit RPN8/RPN11